MAHPRTDKGVANLLRAVSIGIEMAKRNEIVGDYGYDHFLSFTGEIIALGEKYYPAILAEVKKEVEKSILPLWSIPVDI